MTCASPGLKPIRPSCRFEMSLSEKTAAPKEIYPVETNDSNGGIGYSETLDLKKTKRHLLPRHIQLIAISGAIGTGLFIGTGASLQKAGPAGLFLGYCIYGGLIYIAFNSMGEMVSYLPIDGSYVEFASRFVDNSFGFALGWLVFYNYAVTVAAEATAVAGMINYWNTDINNAVWCTIFLVSIIIFNVWGVKWFGEGEFYFSLFKVFLIIGLLIFTFITMVGGNPQGEAFGFRNWNHPGAFHHYIASGTWGNFLGFFSTFVGAAYAYGGPDYIAMTAGEAKYPRRIYPNVFRRVIWRLLVFYIGGVLAVGILVPYDNPDLGSSKKGAGSSPFVLAMVNMGIPALPSIVNAAILTSAWSCGLANSYTASRVLYSLALRGTAPAIFRKTARGVPILALAVVVGFGCLSYMSVSNSAATAFGYIVNITGATWILNMGLQQIIYIGFRRGIDARGIDRSTLPFAVKRQLPLAWFALVCYMFLFLTNGWVVFTHGNWASDSFLFAYLSAPILVVLYCGHKIYSVIRGGRWGLHPAHEIDLDTARDEVDEDEKTYPPVPTGRWAKFLHWLWGA
ncbi:Proline-specific permease [Exophiala dermatitidis]|uniref:AAT family amino acid transporter n=1 Tax=Exophiala dermatitidis (strain ATCC 34100 / CBS 525.76 / NIH/UT8656) TaxID=858893 RepID=H6C2X2_EXODN|nr:AAT family amino acid transporter [Exophiala dermatitidis NIH/UT8656]EHY57987.1 AAT family amino acid transporter [Exophiala dermatitidis NIH/UT8656]